MFGALNIKSVLNIPSMFIKIKYILFFIMVISFLQSNKSKNIESGMICFGKK